MITFTRAHRIDHSQCKHVLPSRRISCCISRSFAIDIKDYSGAILKAPEALLKAIVFCITRSEYARIGRQENFSTPLAIIWTLSFAELFPRIHSSVSHRLLLIVWERSGGLIAKLVKQKIVSQCCRRISNNLPIPIQRHFRLPFLDDKLTVCSVTSICVFSSNASYKSNNCVTEEILNQSITRPLRCINIDKRRIRENQRNYIIYLFRNFCFR